MKRSKHSFVSLLGAFGLKRILIGVDLWLSVVLTTGVAYLWFQIHWLNVDRQFFELCAQICAGLFGILFGAFAIIIALSDEKFTRLLKQAKVFNNLVFPFWYVAGLYIVAVILNLLSILSFQFKDLNPAFYFVGTVSVFFTFYCILSTFYRIAATVKMGVYRAELIDFEPKKDDSDS